VFVVAATEVVGASRAADDVECGRYATPQEHLHADGTCDLCLGSQVISWTALEAPHTTRSAHRTERNFAGIRRQQGRAGHARRVGGQKPGQTHRRLPGVSRSAMLRVFPDAAMFAVSVTWATANLLRGDSSAL
jgi:hypothetical protein